MTLYAGEAVLETKDGLYGRGRCINGSKVGKWVYFEGLMEVTYNEDGLEDGESRSYHRTGGLAETGVYKNGKPIGSHRVFYEDGTLKELSEYDGRGYKISYKGYYPDGIRRLYQTFDEDKKNYLKYEAWYKEDGSLWQYSRSVRGKCVYKKRMGLL